MKVNIIEPSGYCVGVANAFSLAHKVREEYPNKTIVVLGMLVHNDDALKELKELNIKTLFSKDKSILEMVDEIQSDDIVILTAHGHPLSVEEKLKERGIKYFDATCPFVKNAHKQIEDAIKENHQVIYIGKKNHPEALSALSLSKNVILYEIKEGMDETLLKDKSPLLLSQTTFSKMDVENIEKSLKHNIEGLRFAPSVCNAASKRQEALLNIQNDVDIIVIVGGKSSNNTKTLYDLAVSHYQDKKVIFIQNEDDIKVEEFAIANNVAIISGTSTPKYVLERIREKIIK